MNIQTLVFGFAGLSAFTLIAIGAFQNNQWMVTTGVGLITYILGYYMGDKKVVASIKKLVKK
jgi:uncharacterized membrane protein SirB2